MRFITLALCAVSILAAATPDLNGTWKLNSSKSDFGQFPAPSLMTQKVVHAEPKLTVDLKIVGDMGEFNVTANYTTDGKETTIQAFGGSEAKSSAKWDGETLLIETKGSFGDTSYTTKDKWTLSEGGKVLTINRHFSSAMGEMDQRMVFEKQ